MTADVTTPTMALRGFAAAEDRARGSMNLDLFEDADWRRKIGDQNEDGSVAVTLSTGKTVTVNSRFLALLRLLADELAADDAPMN